MVRLKRNRLKDLADIQEINKLPDVKKIRKKKLGSIYNSD